MSKKKIIFGLILVFLGLILLGESMNLFSIAGDLWPLALIGLGLYFILKKRDESPPPKEEQQPGGVAPPPPGRPTEVPRPETVAQPTVAGPQAPSTSAPGKLRYDKTFGDMYIDLDGHELQSVEVSSFVSDNEISVRGGKLSPGLNRLIISGFIGDIRIWVPKGMPVYAQASAFVGDLEVLGHRASGMFGNNVDGQTSDYTDAEAKLYISANIFIGDVKILIV